MAYRDLKSATARIDRRNTRYRFDLEQDIPWAELAGPGVHFGPRLLERVGIDAAGLAGHPDAMEMLQWSVGLEVCRAFSALEGYLLDFVDEEHEVLGPSKSVMMLYQEERKHIALFERYAHWLEAQHPEWMVDFEIHFDPILPALINPYNREEYPEATARHCFFWLKTLFFEEYTIFLHEALAEEADAVKNVWLVMHEMHRVEEVQHVVTDAAHVDDLDMSPTERKAMSTAFWSHLDQTFELFLGVAASRSLVRARFPECSHCLPDLQTRELPIFRELFTHAAFRHTRRLAPGGQRYLGLEVPVASSLIEGPTLSVAGDAPWTLAGCLDATLSRCPDRGLTLLNAQGEGTFRPYSWLREEALQMLDGLRRRGVEAGERVILCTQVSEDLIIGLWACLLGGQVPVPLAPPTVRGGVTAASSRLVGVLGCLGSAWLVAPQGVLQPLGNLGETRVISLDLLRAHRAEAEVISSPADPDALGLIQFSSGSTGQPKGVRLTQRQLLHNIRAIRQSLGGRPDDLFMSWLPLFHDMGLIGYHLLPIVGGCSQVLMPTTLFLRRPVRWLELLSHHQATVTASPSFGLGHVLNRVRPEQLRGVDLSSIHCLLNGAEPISWEWLSGFQDLLEPFGLARNAMRPAYGMAEATLCLTASPGGADVRMHTWSRESLGTAQGVEMQEAGAKIVDLGVPVAGVSIRVVDPQGQLCPQGVVGAVEAQGPGLSDGYEGDPGATAAAFEGGWLKTGDRGVIVADRLSITGRDKDLIIVNGVNLHAHDLEAIAADVEGVHPRRVAAFGIPDPDRGRDRIVLVLGLTQGPVPWDRLQARLQTRLGETLGIQADHVVRVSPRDIPRTTSGKLQRRRLQARYELGELDRLERPAQESKENPPTEPQELIGVIQAAWVEALKRPGFVPELDDGFRSIGGSSLQAAHIHAILEDRLEEQISHELLVEADTIREMAHWLESHRPGRNVVAEDSRSVAEEISDLSEERDDEASGTSGRIAIIGLALRLPGASSPDALWQLLEAGEHRFRPVPQDRWDHPSLVADLEKRGHSLCPDGAFLDDLFGFDPEAFSMSRESAAATNPQLRLFMEVAAEALQDAGTGRGSVGVFVSQGESPLNFRTMLDEIAQGGSGLAGSLDNSTNNMVAAQLNRTFDLTGPAMVVQAACASSLVAVQQARRALQHGECDQALVGGVEIIHTPTLYHLFGQSGVLSSTGRCVPFSTDADGFVPGEGAVAVVLKRLEDAQRDGDRVLATIRGGAVGNDGQVFSQMAPNPRGQIDVMSRALAEANVDPATIELIETHGTATPVGDTVELRALREVYGETGALVGLSSIKSNLGHLLAAAGLASLVKVVLSLQHRTMAPIAGLRTLNPRLGLDGGRFVPLDSAQPWPRPAHGRRRAAVNSLGIGGTNCHLILEEGPERAEPFVSPEASLLCVSGQSPGDLKRVARQWGSWLQQQPDVDRDAFCGEANRRSMLRRTRAAAVVRSTQEAQQFLLELSRGERDIVRGGGPLVFAFPGPGSQHPGMGLSLLEQAPVFSQVFDECDRIARPRIGCSLRDLLTDEPEAMDRIERAQPLVFALSLATARWLQSLGVQPDALMGHSAGEYAAAVVGGALSLRDGLELLITRGQAMATADSGTLCAIFADRSSVEGFLDGLEESLWISTLNAPGQVGVSGRMAGIEALESRLQEEGIRYRRLAVGCAAHSPLMTPASETLAQAAASIRFHRLRVPMFSSLKGSRVVRLSGDYLRAQLIEPVRFQAAVESMLDAGFSRVVELGGSGVLSPAIEATAQGRGRRVQTASVHRRGRSGLEPALEALAQIFEGGTDLVTGRLPMRVGQRVSIPQHPYQRQEMPIALAAAQVAAQSGPSVDAPPDQSPSSTGWMGRTDFRLCEDHRAQGQCIAPAAWMLEQIFSSRPGLRTLRDVVIQAPLQASLDLQWKVQERESELIFSSRPHAGSEWKAHVQACRSEPDDLEPVFPCRPQHARSVDVDAVYAHLSRMGMEYGPGMRSLRSIRAREDQLWVELSAPESEEWRQVDPRILDGAFQALAAWRLLSEKTGETSMGPYLGFAIGQIERLRPLRGPAHAWIQRKSALREDTGVVRCDILLADVQGRVCLVLRDFCARRKGQAMVGPGALAWNPLKLQATGSVPLGGIAVLGKDGASIALRLLKGGSSPVFGPITLDSVAGSELSLAQVDRAILLHPTVEQIHTLVQLVESRPRERTLSLVVLTESRAVVAMIRSVCAEPLGLVGQAILLDAGLEISPDALWQAMSEPKWSWLRWDGATLSVPTVHGVSSVREPPELKSEGVYWILGGSGGIGLALSHGLAERCRPQLVLSGRRTELNSETRASLEALGAVVHYHPLDLGDGAAVSAASHRIYKELGRLDGVIHCAGVRQDGRVRGREIGQLHQVMTAKMVGGAALIDALSSKRPEFLVFVSSLTSLVPSAGQADYAAANGALDDLAWRHPDAAERVMSINFGPWAETGMVATESDRRNLKRVGLVPMTTRSGVKAFFQALELDVPQVVVSGLALQDSLISAMQQGPDGSRVLSTPDPVRAFPVSDRQPKSALSPAMERLPKASTSSEPGFSDFLRSRIGRLLKVDPDGLDSTASFAELGVDSLMAVQLIRSVEGEFGLQLYPTLLFEHPTLQAFERYLQQHAMERRVQMPTPTSTPMSPRVTGAKNTEAYVVDRRGTDVDFRRESRPLEPLKADEICIQVEAWGVNFIDVLSGVGLHPVLQDPLFVPGHEVAGLVVEVGARVEDFRPGDRVMALLGQGGYARQVMTPAHLAMSLPPTMTFAEGASLVVTGLTAVACVEEAARLRKGESILIQSAAGATGMALVQLALHHGATVFGTASAPEKLKRLRTLGVHHPIPYTQVDFVDAVREQTDGVDVIVDSLSGEAITKGLGILRQGGRFIELGAGSALEVPSIDPAALFLRNQSFMGVNISQMMSEPARLARLQDRLRELMEKNVLRPTIGHRLSFEQAHQAHQLLRSRQSIGKIVLIA